MCLAIIDSDTAVFKACMIAEKTVYDILPLTIKDIPTEKVVDIEDDTTYQQYIVQTFSYASEYKDWLKKIEKDPEDFLRVSRVVMEPLSHALHILDTMMREMVKMIEPEQLAVWLTGDNNFRDDIAKLRPYKETRRDKPKPVYYEAAREFLIKKWGAKVIDGMEADDMCGIIATACQEDGTPYVIAAVDKDLNSIPGMHYNYDKKKFYNVSVYEAEHWFWVQALAGDSTDCIPGLYRVGEVAADKILGKSKTYATMRVKARAAYDKAFKKDQTSKEQRYARYKSGDELLAEQGRLVHMMRHIDEVWQP